MKVSLGWSPYKKGKNKNKLISVWHCFDKEMGIEIGVEVLVI